MSNRFLRLPEVKLRVGLSRSSIYLRVEQGTFPRSIPLGKHSIAWREEDIDRWMAQRVAAAAADSPNSPKPLQHAQEAASAPEHRADAAIGPVMRLGKRGFAARQSRTPALMGVRDGRR